MPFPVPTYPRKPLHNRSINVHSFEREDGLWDVEAELIDSKAFSYVKRNGVEQQAGQAFHHMHLRITIDSDFTIQDAMAMYDASPFGEPCTSIAPAYRDLIGMNLLKNFRQQVKERFSRTAGCTHMSELAAVLPTAAVQTMSGQRRNAADPTKRPYQLGGCTAWRLDGEITKELYPQWYIAPKTSVPETSDK